MDASRLLLSVALTHRIVEPNIEAGFERFVALTGDAMRISTFCEAVAACVRAGLIRDPIRLPDGALQCHWHLELTPAGVAAAFSVPLFDRFMQRITPDWVPSAVGG